MTNSWIQIDGKLIPKEDFHGNNVRGHSTQIMEDIKPFVSPIDGSIISSRPHLKAHMKKHGVTNTADYSPEFLANKRKEIEGAEAKAAKADRIESLRHIKES